MSAALCLLWAATAASLPAADDGPLVPGEIAQPGHHVTLSWTHSIERVRWVEQYQILATDQLAAHCPPQPRPVLCPVRVRVLGSAAGMEPAPSAVWRAGAFEWTPDTGPVMALRLMHSRHAADYTLCVDGHCQPLARWLGRSDAATDGVVRLRACHPDTDGVKPPPATKRSG